MREKIIALYAARFQRTGSSMEKINRQSCKWYQSKRVSIYLVSTGMTVCIVVSILNLLTVDSYIHWRTFAGVGTIVKAEAETTAAATATEAPPPIQRLLSFYGPGRLGNQLFRFAALLGISTRYNRRMTIDASEKELLSVFPDAGVVSVDSCASRLLLGSPKFATYDAAFEHLPDKDICSEGYFQSWRYFRDVEKTLRSRLAFSARVGRRAATLYDRALKKGVVANSSTTVVGVHVRRGDYRIAVEYNMPSVSYYRKAMEYFKRKTRNAHFLVVSDDIEWCKTNLNFFPEMTFHHNSAAVDLALLSSCQHIIISVGTYGWWSAWLAGGSVVYFDNFISKSSNIFSEFKSTDFYPPSWIPMGD